MIFTKSELRHQRALAESLVRLEGEDSRLTSLDFQRKLAGIQEASARKKPTRQLHEAAGVPAPKQKAKRDMDGPATLMPMHSVKPVAAAGALSDYAQNMDDAFRDLRHAVGAVAKGDSEGAEKNLQGAKMKSRKAMHAVESEDSDSTEESIDVPSYYMWTTL